MHVRMDRTFYLHSEFIATGQAGPAKHNEEEDFVDLFIMLPHLGTEIITTEQPGGDVGTEC